MVELKLLIFNKQDVLSSMEELRYVYDELKNIPKDEVIRSGFSRVFNGKRHILFKQLTAGSGAALMR